LRNPGKVSTHSQISLSRQPGYASTVLRLRKTVMGGIRMINRRVLSICNYALGIYTLICSLLFIWTLSDVKELIEVHQWHGCSNYKDYPTYVASGSIVLAFCAAAFFGCWLLLKFGHLKSAFSVLGITGIGLGLAFWLDTCSL
jgi:hypothetical protein